MSELRRQHPSLFWILVISSLACLVMIYAGVSLGGTYDNKVKKLKRDQAILSSLRQAPVALTAENVIEAQDFLAELELRVVQVESGLSSKSWGAAPTFMRPEDVYFDVFTMVEDQREAFERAGIQLSDTEQFGYGSVMSDQRVTLAESLDTTEGQAHVERLYRQKQTLAAALGALAQSGAAEVISVERTSLVPLEEGAVLRPDMFEFDPRLSLAREGVIETHPVRIEFRGKTASLRNALIRFQDSAAPIALRDLEIKQAKGAVAAQPSRSSGSRSPFRSFGRPQAAASVSESLPSGVAIVDSNDSIFVLYLEGYYILPSSAEAEEVEQ